MSLLRNQFETVRVGLQLVAVLTASYALATAQTEPTSQSGSEQLALIPLADADQHLIDRVPPIYPQLAKQAFAHRFFGGWLFGSFLKSALTLPSLAVGGESIRSLLPKSGAVRIPGDRRSWLPSKQSFRSDFYGSG